MNTAHGKVIVLGEHAVVYGRPALAAALSPGAHASLERAERECVSLHVASWARRFVADDGSDLGRALAALAHHLGVSRAHVVASLCVPSGGGLGGSAALGVAVARTLGEARGRAVEGDELLDAALAWEKVFHGTPSGIDHTLAALGGVGVFTRAEGLRRVVPAAPLRLCIGDTGERGSTREMVALVAQCRQRRPETTETTFDAIASLVRNGALALEAGDARALGELMTLNQALLAGLMVSTERIEALCRAARDAGAHGAKLTGSGGGGCVIALAGEHEHAVLDAWRTLGVNGIVVEVGVT
jgi:mevalonate kinase